MVDDLACDKDDRQQASLWAWLCCILPNFVNFAERRVSLPVAILESSLLKSYTRMSDKKIN